MDNTTEQNIMHKINKLNNLFLNTIETVIEQTKTIENDILDISSDNNFFIEHPEVISTFQSLFSFNSLYQLKEQIHHFGDIVNTNIINTCEHEWVDDYIDIDLDKSMNITYCKKCETTKK